MVAERIPREEFEARQAKVRESLGREGFDAALVVGRSFYDRPGDLIYLTNHFPPFPSTVFQAPIEALGHGFFLLPAKGGSVLLDAFHRKEVTVTDEVRIGPNLLELLVDVIREKDLASARIALVGSDLLPVAAARVLEGRFPDLRLTPADHLVRSLRREKSEAEVEALRRAARVAAAGLAAARAVVEPGIKENRIAGQGIGAAMAAGADFVRYFRVHTGPWSLMSSRWPQALPRPVEEGDIVYLDIIGAVEGYQFDVLRTTVAGEPGAAQRKMLEACLAIQDEVLAACRPGTSVTQLLDVARRAAERLGYGPYLVSLLGHGIGLETMETPLLFPGVEDVLEEGMVLCIEPALQVPGVGGCSIEDEIVIRSGGAELLTDYPRRTW